jgi:hypothetical protein
VLQNGLSSSGLQCYVVSEVVIYFLEEYILSIAYLLDRSDTLLLNIGNQIQGYAVLQPRRP